MYSVALLEACDLFITVDRRFAGLMGALAPDADAAVPLAAALVSRSLRQGDVCIDLETYAGTTLKGQAGGQSAVKCPSLLQWRQVLLKSGIIGKPGEYKPLIIDEKNRLYLHRYWEYEEQLASFILERAARPLPPGSAEALRSDLVGASLRRLFPDDNGGDIDWQKAAAIVALLKPLCIISGGPGTGKTHAVARILALLLEQHRHAGRELVIHLAAPTGKAASRLTASISAAKQTLPCDPSIIAAVPDAGMTIHRMLGSFGDSGRFLYNAENRLAADVVVVDEASMVDLPLMSKLVQALPDDSRLLLLGDRDQLASVEAGAVLGDICGEDRTNVFSAGFREQVKAFTGLDLPGDFRDMPGALTSPGLQDCRVYFTRSHRFDEKSGIPKLSIAVNRGEPQTVIEGCANHAYADVRWYPLDREDEWRRHVDEKIIQHYGRLGTARNPFEAIEALASFKILCALNHGPYGVAAMNARATALLETLAGRRRLQTGHESGWYHGRPILIRKNDHQLALYNGDIGVALQDPDSPLGLSVYFAETPSDIRRFAPHRLPEHETAYAMTIHKSQGSEFDEILMVLPDKDAPILTRELIYTGITRARRNLSILCSQSAISLAISRRIERRSGLRDKLLSAR